MAIPENRKIPASTQIKGIEAVIDGRVLPANPDQIINTGDGFATIASVYKRPDNSVIDFRTSGQRLDDADPVYDNFTIPDTYLTKTNLLNKWDILFSCNTVPAIISSPPTWLTVTGEILVGYANLNRIKFELDQVYNAVDDFFELKVICNITQAEGANQDSSAPDPDLIGFYQMSEGEDDYVNIFDDSVYANHASTGLDSYSTRVAGIIGNQLEMLFDGSSGNFTLPHNSSMDFANGITVMSWVTIASAKLNTTVSICSKDVAAVPAGGFTLFKETTGIFRFHLGQASLGEGDGGSRVRSTTTAIEDTPMHVCATWDGANTKMYINGVLENTTAYAVSLVQGTDPLIVIGGQATGFREGNKIDQHRIYKSALSDAEILAIYNTENPV